MKPTHAPTRRPLWPLLIAALLLALSTPISSSGEARAEKGDRAKKLAKHRAKKLAKHRANKRANKSSKKTRRVKARRKSKRRMKVKRRRGYRGQGVAKEDLRTEALPKPTGELWLYAENFREEVKLNIYNDDGSINQSALASLDHTFRCKRTQEERAVDPRLYETLSMIQDHFGGKKVILTSGFRFQRNEGSRHFHASAMDIRIDGVSNRELYQFAESLDTGGMGIGIYPRSGFVHVDFRAPGEPSYRWTDNSRGRRGRGKSPSKSWRGKKPKS